MVGIRVRASTRSPVYAASKAGWRSRGRYRDGPLELTATAWDTQGNQGRSAPRTMVIENRPSTVVAFHNPPGYLTGSTDAHLEWEADEPLSRSLCSLDGAPYTDCSNPLPGRPYAALDYQGLADGVHIFRAITVDEAGKSAVDAEHYQWVVDTRGLGVSLLMTRPRRR